MGLYQAMSAAVPTTAAPAKITLTAATIKTILQVATPSTADLLLVAWGVSFDGAAAAAAVQCELVTTGAVAATVTSFTPQLYSADARSASAMAGGTALTGFNASAEGTVTTTQHYDLQLVDPAVGYSYDWPLGREGYVPVSTVLRIRCTAPAGVGVYGWVRWDE